MLHRFENCVQSKRAKIYLQRIHHLTNEFNGHLGEQPMSRPCTSWPTDLASPLDRLQTRQAPGYGQLFQHLNG